MFSNKRRRLVGILLAIAVPALIGAMAVPANALIVDEPLPCAYGSNLVANCGFEASTSTPIAHWTHLVSHSSFLSTSVVHTGAQALGLQSTGDDDVYTQTLAVKPHTQYVVSAWIDAVTSSGSPNNDFTLAATNINSSPDATTIYTNSNIGGGWFEIGGIVTTTSASTMTLVIRGANVPNATYVDDVRVVAQRSGCAAIANDLVDNCGFENSTPDPWVKIAAGSGSDSQLPSNEGANGGAQSLRLAATGTQDDAWYQVLTVRPHTQYRLTYWTEYIGGGTPNNDLTVSVTNVPAASGGIFKSSTLNIPSRYWTQTTATFTTGNGSTATLKVAGRNVPASTFVDDVSVTAVPHVHVSAKGRAITTMLTGLGGQKVTLQKLVNKHWVAVHSWTAPKTGWSKSWSFTVGSGGSYRSVSGTAPGYGSATSNTISVK